MCTELGFYAAMFCYDHGQLLVSGDLFSSLRTFPFIRACFFSGSFRFSHEQQKLEDIGGGILTYGHAVEITIKDEWTPYPLVC